MMVDPHTQKQSTQHRWEVLKGQKIYPIATDELLVRLWQEKRLSSITSIRRAGEQEWRESDSINWSTFIEMVAESDGKPTDQSSAADTADEAAETTEIAITEESLREEAALAGRATFVAQAQATNQAPAWWRDESATGSTVQSSRRLAVIYAIAALASTILFVGLAIWSIRWLSPSATKPADTLVTAPGPTTLPPASAESAPDVNATVDANATPNLVNDAATDATTDAGTDAGTAVAAIPDTDSAASDTKDQRVTEAPIKPDMPPLATPAEPQRDATQTLAIQDSASPSQPSKIDAPAVQADPVDKKVQDLVERFEGSLSVYSQTRQEIMKCREEIKKSEAELIPALESKNRILTQREHLTARIKQAMADMQASIVFINANGGMASTSAIVQAEKNRFAGFQRESLGAQQVIGQLNTEFNNIEARELNHAKLVKDIGTQVQSITQREVASLDKFLELMDFFGDKPQAYHRQVFEKTEKVLHKETDFFYAQVLNSAAAIQLKRYDVPRKNLTQINSHIQSIEPGERKLRLVALSRFHALALGLSGLNDWHDGRRETSVKQLDQAVKQESRILELRLARGMVGIDLKGLKDGLEHFNWAAKIDPNDARVYRIGLDSLLASKSPPTQNFPKLLEKLLKVTLEDDEPSWLTAAQTSIALQKFDEARQYLDKVSSPMFETRKQRLLAALP